MRLIHDDVWAILTIWMEARGEPMEGKVGVGEVMRDRARQHFNCDGTLVGAILAPYQFSGWNTQDPNRLRAARLDDADPAAHECRQAWAIALEGSAYVKGALLYYNPAVVTTPPAWATPTKRTAIWGAHHFFAA